MEVVRLNNEVEDSGWYEWMLIRWSSEPEASKRPLFDQLRKDVSKGKLYRDSRLDMWLPQCVYTSNVTLQLVHNVHVLDPLAVPINAAEARISRAGAHLALEKAVVHGVLHRFVVKTLVMM
jgi:hypothetical protein